MTDLITPIPEAMRLRKHWTIRKYADDEAYARGEAYEVSEFEENVLLNGGITVMLNLICGIAATAFSNANARLGVGDDNTAAAAAQTGLIAASNKTYKAMEASYPSVASQTMTFRSVFGSADANYAWNEFTVDNGTTAMNRRVSAQGTKASGQTWTLDLAITLS